MLRWRTHDGTVEFFEDAEGSQAPAGDPVAEIPVIEREVAPGDADGPLRAGTVEFWHMQNQYGFIRPDDPGEPPVWVDAKALEGFAEALPHLAKGERVLYDAVPSELRPRDASEQQEDRQQAIRVLPEQRRRRGVVSEYSFMHGYGSVDGDDGTRCFLHRTNVLGGNYKGIIQGDQVFFTVDENDARSGPDPVAKAVKVGDPRPALYRFAQFPNEPGQWLAALRGKAAQEDWDYHHEYATDRTPYPILRHYLATTFERLLEEQRMGRPMILDGTTPSGRAYAIFHTGLVDALSAPIYALFHEHFVSGDPRRWWLRGFVTEDEGPMREVAELPSPASYLEEPSALTITPGEIADMRVDMKHILGDNLNRFPGHLRSDPELARQVFEGELRELPDRIRRNYRLPVAQYYRGSVHLLLPLHLSGASRRADLALVVERTAAGVRRASTVFGNDHAYQQSRLIARPEADWLGHAWLDPDDAASAKASTGESQIRKERRSVAA